MKTSLKNFVRNTLKKFNLAITHYSTLETLNKNISAAKDLEILQRLNGIYSKELLQYFSKSKGQLRQDLFVLAHLGFKRNGFFVEFGAANGLDLSNTHLLEKEFGWGGILAEPAACWQKEIRNNRNCHIESNCVWSDSHSTLTFNQVEVPELSTINSFSNSDGHKDARKKGETYEVKTISLNDLLKKHNAPKKIDYLSIDTEGSEYEILSHFDFSEYSFEVITCEHNFTPLREKLFSLLTQQGYQRVFEDVSAFDDWYIKTTQKSL
jgi:FkbM family methyltransferase